MPAAMDAKQLSEVGRQIVKANDGGDSAATILSLLQPLQDFVATEALLRSSKIGVYVNKLRQNKDTKVSEAAARLINKWKSDVKKTSAAKSSGSPAPGAKSTGPSTPIASATNGATTSVASPAVKAEKGTGRKSKVAPDQRTSDKDEVNTQITKDPARDGCLKLIYNGLCYLSTELPDDILAVAQAVEHAASVEYAADQKKYKEKMRSLFMNLKMKDNGWLRDRVFSGAISPQNFVTMTSDELKSKQRKAEDEQLEKENMKEAMTAEQIKSISKTMPCRRCGAHETAYTQAQTRAADEPMTTFCECIACGNRWKFS